MLRAKLYKRRVLTLAEIVERLIVIQRNTVLMSISYTLDGSAVSDKNDYRRSAVVVRQIEKPYGLTRAAHTPRQAWQQPVKSISKMDINGQGTRGNQAQKRRS